MASKKSPGGFRLTMKTARELCLQEFGTAKGLQKVEGTQNRYEMRAGNMIVNAEPFEPERGVRLVILTVWMNGGNGRCFQIHHADTLARNDVEERLLKKAEREEAWWDDLRDWIEKKGAAACHAYIDKVAGQWG